MASQGAGRPRAPRRRPSRSTGWLLFVHPLTYASSAGVVWLLVGATLLLLFALPWLPQPAAPPVARVDPANCNGCRRCFDDCPYAAITMVPHPNGKIGQRSSHR